MSNATVALCNTQPRRLYTHNCLYLAHEAEGLADPGWVGLLVCSQLWLIQAALLILTGLAHVSGGWLPAGRPRQSPLE